MLEGLYHSFLSYPFIPLNSYLNEPLTDMLIKYIDDTEVLGIINTLNETFRILIHVSCLGVGTKSDQVICIKSKRKEFGMLIPKTNSAIQDG